MQRESDRARGARRNRAVRIEVRQRPQPEVLKLLLQKRFWDAPAEGLQQPGPRGLQPFLAGQPAKDQELQVVQAIEGRDKRLPSSERLRDVSGLIPESVVSAIAPEEVGPLLSGEALQEVG